MSLSISMLKLSHIIVCCPPVHIDSGDICSAANSASCGGSGSLVYPPNILTKIYKCTIEHIVTGCMIVRFGYCFLQDLKALQRIMRAKLIIGNKLPALQNIFLIRCLRKVHKITTDYNPPTHGPLTRLPSITAFNTERVG